MTVRIKLDLGRGNFGLHVDTEFPSSGITSIHGPSGSGKTTILRAIAGLDRHHAARVKVGSEIFQDASTFIAPHLRCIGYVFQESSLFSHLDVRGNIEFGVRKMKRRGEPVDRSQVIDLLELGPMLNRRPASLSGGERRRVAIARALAPNPRLLLLDEPMAGLDTRRQEELLPYLENLHKSLRVPVIHVSHSKTEVMRLADHLVILESGEVSASGALADVQTRLDLPMAQDDAAATTIQTRVIDIDEDYGLATLEFGHNCLTVLNRHFVPGQRLRVSIAARDVSISLEAQQDSSILNIFRVKLDAISELDNALVLLRMNTGNHSLLARVTRKSAEKLGLSAGMDVFVQVKGIAVLR